MENMNPFKRHSGATEIGMIITCFFMLIMIIIPLNLALQELAIMNSLNLSIQTATELAMIDMIKLIDIQTFSEGNIYFTQSKLSEMNSILAAKIKASTGFAIEPTELSFELRTEMFPNKIEIKYQYTYLTKVFLKNKLTKKIFVNLLFELPINK